MSLLFGEHMFKERVTVQKLAQKTYQQYYMNDNPKLNLANQDPTRSVAVESYETQLRWLAQDLQR